jgi:hypothetical protein
MGQGDKFKGMIFSGPSYTIPLSQGTMPESLIKFEQLQDR